MKKLDFSNIKIIHKFKRANLVEAEKMLLNATNLNNLSLVYEINDVNKLKLLVKHGLFINKLTQKKLYGQKNDVYLLHNISTEKLNFLIFHGLELLDFCPLSHLHTPENFSVYMEYLSSAVGEPFHYFLENHKSTKSFIATLIEKKQFKTIDIIIPFVNQDLFWELGILKAIENINFDSLYFLYKRNILNQNLILKLNPLEEIKKILQLNIDAAQKDINNYYNEQELYKKYGSTVLSPGRDTLKDKKQKTISLTYSKKDVYNKEQTLSKINEAWPEPKQFLTYFIEKEKKELQEILNSKITHNKKRL